MNADDGIERGRRLWDIERDLALAERGSRSSPLFLPHAWLIHFLNLYYVIAHYNVLLLMLAWLLWRHRDRYREARTVIGLATFACLAVQLVPVAPPRLIGGHGIVDTADQVRPVGLRPGGSGVQRPVLGDALGAYRLVLGGGVLHLAIDEEPLALSRRCPRVVHLDRRRRHRKPLLARRTGRDRVAGLRVLDGAPGPVPVSRMTQWVPWTPAPSA